MKYQNRLPLLRKLLSKPKMGISASSIIKLVGTTHPYILTIYVITKTWPTVIFKITARYRWVSRILNSSRSFHLSRPRYLPVVPRLPRIGWLLQRCFVLFTISFVINQFWTAIVCNSWDAFSAFIKHNF